MVMLTEAAASARKIRRFVDGFVGRRFMRSEWRCGTDPPGMAGGVPAAILRLLGGSWPDRPLRTCVATPASVPTPGTLTRPCLRHDKPDRGGNAGPRSDRSGSTARGAWPPAPVCLI